MKILQDEAVNAARIGQVESASSVSQSAVSGQGSTESPSSVESPAATVSFSTQAQDIAKAKAAVNAAPDVREDLVSSLKSRVESGTYNVSGADVADMMMRRMTADQSVNG